jgi:hypothetical protein
LSSTLDNSIDQPSLFHFVTIEEVQFASILSQDDETTLSQSNDDTTVVTSSMQIHQPSIVVCASWQYSAPFHHKMPSIAVAAESKLLFPPACLH